MSLRSVIRSRWVKLSLAFVVLLVLAGGGTLAYRLATTTPAMYAPSRVTGDVPSEAPSVRAGDAETLVYTSLRPSNRDVYLFDGLEAAPIPGPARTTREGSSDGLDGLASHG